MTDQRDGDPKLDAGESGGNFGDMKLGGEPMPDGTASTDGDGPANDVIADAQQVPMDDAAGGPQADAKPDETYDEGDTATEEMSVQGGE